MCNFTCMYLFPYKSIHTYILLFESLIISLRNLQHSQKKKKNRDTNSKIQPLVPHLSRSRTCLWGRPAATTRNRRGGGSARSSQNLPESGSGVLPYTASLEEVLYQVRASGRIWSLFIDVWEDSIPFCWMRWWVWFLLCVGFCWFVNTLILCVCCYIWLRYDTNKYKEISKSTRKWGLTNI